MVSIAASLAEVPGSILGSGIHFCVKTLSNLIITPHCHNPSQVRRLELVKPATWLTGSCVRIIVSLISEVYSAQINNYGCYDV